MFAYDFGKITSIFICVSYVIVSIFCFFPIFFMSRKMMLNTDLCSSMNICNPLEFKKYGGFGMKVTPKLSNDLGIMFNDKGLQNFKIPIPKKYLSLYKKNIFLSCLVIVVLGMTIGLIISYVHSLEEENEEESSYYIVLNVFITLISFILMLSVVYFSKNFEDIYDNFLKKSSIYYGKTMLSDVIKSDKKKYISKNIPIDCKNFVDKAVTEVLEQKNKTTKNYLEGYAYKRLKDKFGKKFNWVNNFCCNFAGFNMLICTILSLINAILGGTVIAADKIIS